jgi:WhiB family transcriptional regulator, redox-sensing transcriptional regulator
VTANRPGTGRLAGLMLPPGVEVRWQHDAACKDAPDPDVFFPGKTASAEAAKQVCAGCPVIGDCLEFALATMPAPDRDHGVYGGLTPAERARLAGGPLLIRAHRLDSRAQAVIGRRLATRLGLDAAARALGVTLQALTDAWRRHGLAPTPSRQSPQQASEWLYRERRYRNQLYHDRTVAEQALQLARQIGMKQAATTLGVTHGVLYRAWQHHGLDRPAHQPRQRPADLRAAVGPPVAARRRSRGGDGREEVGDRDRR